MLKSLLRSALGNAGSRIQSTQTWATIRRIVDDVAEQRIVIHDRELTSAAAHAPDVEGAWVRAQDGSLQIDIDVDQGAHLSWSLVPCDIKFAPRGPKEVVWRVIPADLARDRHVVAVAAAVGNAIARALWAWAAPSDAQSAQAIVEREGTDLLRVDLRTTPVIRNAEGRVRMAAEIIDVAAIDARNGSLLLKLKLPPFFPQ